MLARLRTGLGRVLSRGWRQKRLDFVEVVKGGALFWGEVRGKSTGGERSLTLIGRKCAKLAESMRYDAATILGQAGELLHGTAHTLTLLWCKAFHRLSTIKDVLPLLGRHVIQLGEPVSHALLHLGGEVAKAWFAFEGTLLIRDRQIAVVTHPLREMFLTRARAEGPMLCRTAVLLLRIAASRTGRGALPVATGGKGRK